MLSLVAHGQKQSHKYSQFNKRANYKLCLNKDLNFYVTVIEMSLINDIINDISMTHCHWNVID
jgi:hypothetical protein